MLIISPFSDYYDGVASSGIDTIIRYHRQTSTITAKTPFYINHLPTHLMGHYIDYLIAQHRHNHDRAELEKSFCQLQILGFCGTQLVTTQIGDTRYFGGNCSTPTS
jgi:hypothetical protein